MFLVTCGFILFDMVTGIVGAFKDKQFNSSVMREGLFHKCGSIFAIIFGLLVDYAQTLIDLGVNVPTTVAICTYIILMECGSIVENVNKINPEIVPEKIKPYFSKITGKE